MPSAAKVKRKAAQTSLSAVTATGAGSSCDFGIAPVRDVRYFIKATGVTSGATIKFECSPDNSVWFVFGSSVTVSATGNTSALITAAGAGSARYWRANVTARTDGTYTVQIAADADYN